MKSFILKVATIHLVIVVLYVSSTSFIFVVSAPANPIGMGLQQWLCIILHFLLTPWISWILLKRSNSGNILTTKILINVLTVIFWVIVFICFSSTLGKWLWRLRGDAIQIN
jgi:hypothetical protein